MIILDGNLAAGLAAAHASVPSFVAMGEAGEPARITTVQVRFGVITNTLGYVSPVGTSWTNTGNLAVGAGGSTVNASKVNLLGGEMVVQGTPDPTSIDISGSGTLTGNGPSSAIFRALVWLDLVSSFPTPLSEIGNYAQNGNGKVSEFLDSASLFGVLDVTGNVTLGGTLDLYLREGFSPAVGEVFDLINVTDGTISCGFSSILGTDPSDWMFLYNRADNQQVHLICLGVPIPEISDSAIPLIIGPKGIAIASRRPSSGYSV